MPFKRMPQFQQGGRGYHMFLYATRSGIAMTRTPSDPKLLLRLREPDSPATLPDPPYVIFDHFSKYVLPQLDQINQLFVNILLTMRSI